MNCHQILTGACNHGDRTFSVGSVEGVPFTAYAAGCNIVILASNFERVQILPGVVNEDVQISCIDCSVDTGKIAAAYGEKVCIFEPVPLINHNPRHRLDYRWMKTSCISADCVVNNLAWNMEGTRLITGGTMLQIWELRGRPMDNDQSVTSSPPPKPILEAPEEEEEVKKKPKGVSFRIGDDQDHEHHAHVTHYQDAEEEAWDCVWSCTPANPIVYLACSSDGNMFATVGEHDRLVKIWFECKYNAVASISKSFSCDRSMTLGSSQPRHVLYSFVYLAHPRAVTGIQWRKTSKYMPKGSVSNVLVTSCKDNICRLWVETALPDDGLVNVQHLVPPAAQHPKFRTQRHKMRFMQRWKHMKTCFHFFKKNGHGGVIAKGSHLPRPPDAGPIPNLPSTYSAHDFHSYAGMGSAFMPPIVHFHLAGSINAETDIPLVPSMKSNTGAEPGKEPTFVVHWLNNKEMHFTTEAESILLDLGRRAMEEEHGKQNHHHREATNQSDTDSTGGQDSEVVASELGSPKKPVLAGSARTPSEAGEGDQLSGNRSSAASTTSGAHVPNGMASETRVGSGTNLLGDALDRKIELLLRDWHHSPDLLFAVHPVDGSFLVWLVDYIDEVQPNSYRQPQVSFACRIPNALPLGDAGSMSPNLALYCDHLLLDLKHALGLDIPVSKAPKGVEKRSQDVENEDEADGENEDVSWDEEDLNAMGLSRNTSPTISMLSKHFNGSLNLWRVTFAEGSQYSQVLSIGHVSRVCGHRFRVNYIACHPALPLLLSTSHHNTPFGGSDDDDPGSEHSSPSSDLGFDLRGRGGDKTRASLRTSLLTKNVVAKMKPEERRRPPSKSPEKRPNTDGFCSELILWKVDPVGPLSKSGGVTELARLTSPQPSAFANCAWIPTLLPSATLGSISNSPSGCFVASDGTCLRVYQAVIDARSLLAEMSLAERKRKRWPSGSSASSTTLSGKGGRESLADAIKIVSQQSTARPGCIIQLDSIADATHDWQNTEFLHVFQDQLITGERPGSRRKSTDLGQIPLTMGLIDPKDDVFVDLEQTPMFHEPFYVVLIEGTSVGSVLHMWKLIISSQPPNDDDVGNVIYADSSIVQDTGRGISISHTSPPQSLDGGEPKSACPVAISTEKVCTQPLPLPRGTHIVHAAPVAGHLSSASIYPACFAPYLIVTACSDNTVRFWKCDVGEDDSLSWKEWNMFGSDGKSRLEIPGMPLNVSAAYTGRVACAYQLAKTVAPDDEDFSRLVNLCVAIYECESTGGSEWVLEDTIQLKHVRLPQYHLENQVDLAALYDQKLRQQREKSVNAMVRTFSSDELSIPAEHDHYNLQETFRGLIAVPSYSTLQTLKRSIIEKGNIAPAPQKKHLMQIDWVSREDGSHLLTIGVGSKVLIFTPISSDVAQSNLAAMKESQTQFRPVLKKASSMLASTFPIDEIRWMKVREVMLHSADGLPALPMHTSWVRDGILVVAMDSEMHVYSQWKPRHMPVLPGVEPQSFGDDTMKSRCLTESDLRSLAQESAQRRLAHVGSLANLPRTISMASNIHSQALQLSEVAKKKMKLHGVVGLQESHRVMADELPDFGLFEASRIVCPVLPQYHPKQLMELLNSGKIRRVKAILAHLVRCITSSESVAHPLHQPRRTSEDDPEHRRRSWSRSRTLSVSGPPGGGRGAANENVVPEELTLDYVEISSIPPLPLWVLLQADTEAGPTASNVNHGTSQNLHEKKNANGYSDLFDMGEANAQDDDLDNLLSDETDGFEGGGDARRRSLSGDRRGFAYFGPREARTLSQLLTHTHLPGLSSLDQMHLLALADTVASCNLNFAERFAIDAAKAQIAKEGSTQPATGGSLHQSVDDCGLRFLLAMKHHCYLIRCLPFTQRGALQKQGMATSTLVWAFHSESEEEILQAIPSYNRGDIKWHELREIGAGWWLRNNTTLRRCMEKVAKAAFQVKKDPLDAAIFYLAMKKKSLIHALYKSIKDIKMAAFFGNDFTDSRWSKAALKNAYALLGKQRFEHAAAFFLLGGALKDAVEICISKMNDLQLAMVLCRLYDGEREITPPSLRRILYEYILGCDTDGRNQDMTRAHYDPFLRSMAYGMLGDHSASLNTLLQTNVGEGHSSLDVDETPPRNSVQAANPSVFNFYTYLRTHPLIVRQHLANHATDTSMIGMGLSGISSGKAGEGRRPLFEECITSAERRLYFTTAHAHFRAGCPALALEVLSKLPSVVVVDEEGTVVGGLTRGTSVSSPKLVHQKSIATGTLLDEAPLAVSESIDWSQPIAKKEDELVLDWDDHDGEDDDSDLEDDVKARKKSESADAEQSALDEGNLVAEQKKPGKFDIMAQQLKFIACLQILMEELSTLATGCEVDGGQLRFQLYVWLEREVHALRQLCNYNEDFDDHESGDESDVHGEMDRARGISSYPSVSSDKPTLHEILLADKVDFEAKLERAIKRKQWLRANQTLLRTLLSYCSLHGASGGGLASVRMELVLLLQELQQERAVSGVGATQNHLLSPLPLPTTLPLIAAVVAPNKTVVHDPIKHLQSLAQDLLQAVVEFIQPPSPGVVEFPRVFVMRDLGIALSSCIYQCLCDSDSFVVKHHRGGVVGELENLLHRGVVYQNAHLTAGLLRRKQLSDEETVQVTTPPNKWPGVTSLRALLARERDEDAPKLNVLLCESYVAVYVSLLVFGLATCDCHVLYRLIAQDFTERSWASLFGGGAKKLLKVVAANSALGPERKQSVKEDSPGGQEQETGILSSLTKQRLRLNMRLLSFSGQQHSSLKQAMKEDRPTYREQFTPPDMSFLALLMTKPALAKEKADIDYDSTAPSEVSDGESEEEEEIEEDVFKEPEKKKPGKDVDNTEHSDPYSYSWGILRYAVVKIAQEYLNKFLEVAGFELQELPVVSPLIHAVLRVLLHWSKSSKDFLDACHGPPADYIPGIFVERNAGGPAISKYKAILDPNNTPFMKSKSAPVKAIKRLWMLLVHEDSVQEIFIRYIFSSRLRTGLATVSMSDSTLLIGDEASNTAGNQSSSTSRRGIDVLDGPPVPGPVKIIHKEHDSISAFCINKTNPGLMAIATLKEIQELDISLLLQAPAWLEDECEFDILNLHRDAESLPSSSYLVVGERPIMGAGGSGTPVGAPSIPSSASSTHPLSLAAGASTSNVNFAAQNANANQSGRGSTVLKHHKIDNVKRLSAHPLLPLYLSGSQDGSVHLWEWDHANPVSQPRAPGTYAKVTRVRFSQHGNKFGVSDADGNVSLWQLGLNSVVTRPFYTVQSHSKQTTDFVFIGGSSLFASAGHGSDNRNVCIWDTLLPIKRSLVQTFSCHDQGCQSVTYAPQHQMLITGGKKGDVCLIDVRQRTIRHTFAAHHSAVKSIALDPNEEFFVTGSADGDIKVWGLTLHSMVYSFPGEHARSSFFKAQGQGVTQLYVDSQGRLFSCGADGSMKLRHLPVNTSMFV